MENKKYQVFISSTYEDLKNERRAVEEVIISTGDFPVGMEAFPAADEDQFEFIKTVIDTCDYYILIIAGRYGSLAQDGLSFTEKEYRYAVSKNVPVLVMLHQDRGALPVNKSETEKTKTNQLESFIVEVSQGRLRKFWNNVDGLKLAVREALDHAKATKPRTGWVRGDSIASVEALAELNQLRKENAEYKKTIGELQFNVEYPDIPDPNSKIVIALIPTNNGSNLGYGSAVIESTWLDILPIFYANFNYIPSKLDSKLHYVIDEEISCEEIGSTLASLASDRSLKNEFKISKIVFQTLKNYYIETGFMRPDAFGEPFTEVGEKFARRQLITAQIGGAAISLVSGKIEPDIPF